MTGHLPEPCYEASKCLQSMLDYIDVSHEAVVISKLAKLEKMGNENFQMAHPAKALSRCYRKEDGRPVTVKVETEQKGKLATLFRFYCQIGEKRNYQYMSRQQFLRFTRDASLVSYDIDLIELDLMFDKINIDSPKYGDNALRLSLTEFIMAIASAAVRLYPEMDLQAAFDFVMEDNVLPLFEFVHFEDVVGNVLIQEESLKLLTKHDGVIKRIFNHYCAEDEIVGAVTFSDRVAKQTLLSQGAVIKFASDFSIMPDLVSTVKVTHCFQQTMFGVSGDKKAVDFINYNQFLEFLGRLALLAFNFREMEQRPPTVTFNGDDYSEQAKHLWFGNPAEPNPHADSAPRMVETTPLEIRVISPTKRRADPSTGPPPPFLGYSQAAHSINDLLPFDKVSPEASHSTIARLAEQNPKYLDKLSEIERNLKTALAGPTVAQQPARVTSSGRPASARGATRSRPPSAGSRAEPLPQAYIIDDPDQAAAEHRQSISQRVLFSSEWIGKPKEPLLGDRTATLPHYNRFRSSKDLYQTDGIMQPPENAPTVYHSRMHTMVADRIDREQMIDGMIMSWHLEGREIERKKIEDAKARRHELMEKACQLPGSVPRPWSGKRRPGRNSQPLPKFGASGSKAKPSPDATEAREVVAAPAEGKSTGASSKYFLRPPSAKSRTLKTSEEMLMQTISHKKSFGRPKAG